MYFDHRVNQILSEIFQNIPSAEGEYSTLDDSEGKHVFLKKYIKGKTGEHEYGFKATINNDDGKKTANILFYMIKDEMPVSEITGEGNPLEVLNTALGFIKKIDQDYKPDKFIFSAVKGEKGDKESMARTQVYQKLINRFAGAHDFESNVDSKDGSDVFILTRKVK